ncbi:MAG TPA: divalent-cation tolerance protein CutA [candidate division Zixibacteria bacterium]|nr:divalent-cation tolerance protein CutA [candidate division Zixibacteria bacterium]
MNSEVCVVFVSLPRDEARNMAKALVENCLAACVNILPRIESYFTWEGRAEFDEEALLVIKTTPARFEALKGYVEENHPYELPEIIAVPVTQGLSEYVAWVKKESVSEA